MTWIRWMTLGLVVLVLGAGGVRDVRAGDEDAKEEEARAKVRTSALELLQAQVEAAVTRAAILRQAGSLEDALAVYAELETLLAKERERVAAMLARLSATEPERIPTPPLHVEVEPVPPPPAGPGAHLEPVRLAVEKALAWLAAHQSADGGWAAREFDRWCEHRQVPPSDDPDGRGKPLYDVGVSALSLLAFLRAGYTHLGDHPYAGIVGMGLHRLSQVQDAEGCIGSREGQHYIYNHAISTLAFVTAYARTKDERLLERTQKALDFCARARNPYFAWRYGIRPGDNDTSITGWMIQALAAARDLNRQAQEGLRPAPFVLDEEAFDGAFAWVEKMTDRDYGRTGYIQRGGAPARPMDQIDAFPGDKSEAMTAVGIAIRIAVGVDPTESEIVAKGTALLARCPPRWKQDGSIDMYYWYYGTHALAHVGGKRWRDWRRALLEAVLPAQRRDEDPCGFEGSWDPLGPWGPDGGRVYSTALTALTLETVLEHDPRAR